MVDTPAPAAQIDFSSILNVFKALSDPSLTMKLFGLDPTSMEAKIFKSFLPGESTDRDRSAGRSIVDIMTYKPVSVPVAAPDASFLERGRIAAAAATVNAQNAFFDEAGKKVVPQLRQMISSQVLTQIKSAGIDVDPKIADLAGKTVADAYATWFSENAAKLKDGLTTAEAQALSTDAAKAVRAALDQHKGELGPLGGNGPLLALARRQSGSEYVDPLDLLTGVDASGQAKATEGMNIRQLNELLIVAARGKDEAKEAFRQQAAALAAAPQAPTRTINQRMAQAISKKVNDQVEAQGASLTEEQRTLVGKLVADAWLREMNAGDGSSPLDRGQIQERSLRAAKAVRSALEANKDKLGVIGGGVAAVARMFGMDTDAIGQISGVDASGGRVLGDNIYSATFDAFADSRGDPAAKDAARAEREQREEEERKSKAENQGFWSEIKKIFVAFLQMIVNAFNYVSSAFTSNTPAAAVTPSPAATPEPSPQQTPERQAWRGTGQNGERTADYWNQMEFDRIMANNGGVSAVGFQNATGGASLSVPRAGGAPGI